MNNFLQKSFAPAWVKDAIFYQIFPDRFYRSPRFKAVGKFAKWESEPTREIMLGGNLAGIEDKLKYIADLGVNALYLCPIFKSNSNHRYHTVDYMEIDPVLGSLGDFNNLLENAHKLNIRIILDGVFNHCSRGFFQFNSLMELGQNSPYVDWFHIKGWPLNAYNGKPNYECWWDYPALPKFNTQNADVREYLLNVGEYWMRYGIDGWRLDVPNEIDDDSFWQKFRQRIKAINSEAYIVGEIWDAPSRWLKGDQFDGVMNYMFRKAVLAYFFDERAITSEEFCKRIKEAFPNGRGDIPMNLLGSHDTVRIKSLPCSDIERVKAAFALMFFMPGAPCVYYGDELGISGKKDPDNRKSILWENLSKMQMEPIYEFVRKMISLRKNEPALRYGSLSIVAKENGFIVERTYAENSLILDVQKKLEKIEFKILQG